MPIRFRCGFCQTVLGIPSRKAGSVITCPKCQGQIIVPCPEGNAKATQALAEQEARRVAAEAQEAAAQIQAALLADQRRRQEEAARHAEAQRQAQEAAQRQAAQLAQQRCWQEEAIRRQQAAAQMAARKQDTFDFQNTNIEHQNQGGNLAQCYDCGARVSIRATSCPKCGCPFDHGDYDEDYNRTRPRRNLAPHRGGLILILGIFSFLCFPLLGIFAWFMGNNDLEEMRAGRMDPSGEGSTRVGVFFGAFATICLILIVLFLLLYSLSNLGTNSSQNFKPVADILGGKR